MVLWLTPEELEKSKALHQRVNDLLERSDKLLDSRNVNEKEFQAEHLEFADNAMTTGASVLDLQTKAKVPPEAMTFEQTGHEQHKVSASMQHEMKTSAPALSLLPKQEGAQKEHDHHHKTSAHVEILTGQFSGRTMKVSNNPKRKVDLSGMRSVFEKSSATSTLSLKRGLDGDMKGPSSTTSNKMPAWWQGALKPGEKKRIQAKERGILDLLSRLKQAMQSNAKASLDVAELRLALQALEGIKASAEGLTHSRIMEQHNLPQLLPGSQLSENLPFDIQADAQALYTKWFRGDFDCDIWRGIKFTRVAALDQSWPYSSSAKFIGEGHLVNGQWWPYQICALRDGAHGASVAGIFNYDGLAVSIVIAKSKYDDVDNGDVLDYCGTEGKGADAPSADTRYMMNSCDKQQPVRVLRSHTLGGKYAPLMGLRYDGLYKVSQYKLIEASKSHYLFYLKRLPKQHPIRYSGDFSRPTVKEISDFQNHSHRMKGLI